jgi:hypothetical protein
MTEKELQFGTFCWTKEKGHHVVAPFNGNFRGWVQYRKEILGEENMLGHLAELRKGTAFDESQGT